MSPNDRNKTLSWGRLVPILAVLSLALAGAAYFGSDTIAVAIGRSTSPPPGVAVAAPVAVDQSVVEALADGNVSRAEYDAAVNSNLACLDALGILHTDPVYEGFRDRPVWTYSVGPFGEGDGELVAASDECWFKFEADIQVQWVIQHAPSQAKVAANAKAAVACAQQEGIDVETFDELLELRRSGSDDVNNGALTACVVIGAKGYDPRDHQ